MVIIERIESGSLGERAGFQKGDRIHKVNGNEVRDLIDFQVHTADPFLRFDVEREETIYEVDLERGEGDSLGLSFEEVKLRNCNNKCVFCFIHQMPKGMRRSLYFEDDDYRLSFLHGSYVTLTNVKERDIDRIIEQRLSPQYITVHATNPQLRQVMLGRRRPVVDILQRIEKLAANGIAMHTQVVVCPGWNDGQALDRTIEDLRGFYPAVRSVALVPVGLTRFRSKLPQLSPVRAEEARLYVQLAEEWGERFVKELGERLVYAADELFLLLEQMPPAASYYDAFPQLENGIGMVRTFLDAWEQEKGQLPTDWPGTSLGIVTGELGERFIRPICEELRQAPGLDAELVVVKNHYFGEGITVSGLLTGRDILENIRGKQWDWGLLPPNCINGEGITLDDMTVDQLQEKAGMRLMVGKYSLVASLLAFLRGTDENNRGSGRQLSELGYYLGRKA